MAKSFRSKTYINRAETYAKIDLLHKRVNKILMQLGLPIEPKVWIHFDLALFPMDRKERSNILKQIFSKWGTDIKLEHEIYIQMLEKYTKKVLEGFE